MNKKLLLIGTNTIHTFNYLELIEDSFDEIVLVTQAGNDFSSSGLVRKYVVDFSLKNPMNYFKAIKRFKQIIKDEKPDIVHVQQIGTHAYLLMKALKRNKKIPVVATAWGSDILVNPGKSLMYKKMVQYVLNHAAVFTSDSKYMALEMQKLAKRDIEIVIANFGINIEYFSVDKEKVIYSNRLHNPLYRIDKVISAFAKFYEKHHDWSLVIAGTGSETEKLRQQVADKGLEACVKFIGWANKHENSRYYAISRFWVSIPESDATSVSLLEAMSLGSIPVVSDLPANREWVRSGENGYIVSDVDSDFIENALQIDEDKARETGVELVTRYGTKEVNRAVFAGMYQKLIKGHEEY